MFIFEIDFVLKIKDNLCLFVLFDLKLKIKQGREGENSSIFIHKINNEKVIRRKIVKVNLQLRKNE